MSDVHSVPTAADPTRLRNLILVVHGLFAAGLIVPLTPLAGVVVAYIKRPDTAGTIWESHCTYAIRTFFIGLALGVAGLVLSLIGIGVLLLLFVTVWYIVRVVRAFLAWNDGVAIADPRRFF